MVAPYAIRKRAERAKEGSSPRSPDLSAMPRRQLIALVSELQAKIEQAADVTGPLPVANASISDEALAQSALQVGVPSLVVDHSVRSGQIIDYPQGDVTVPSARLAQGRRSWQAGRFTSMARCEGGRSQVRLAILTARIFCRKFRPELLAINGSYRRADDFAAELWDSTVQARLEGLRISLNAA